LPSCLSGDDTQTVRFRNLFPGFGLGLAAFVAYARPRPKPGNKFRNLTVCVSSPERQEGKREVSSKPRQEGAPLETPPPTVGSRKEKRERREEREDPLSSLCVTEARDAVHFFEHIIPATSSQAGLVTALFSTGAR
jgi:hypothetical protein